MTSQLTYAYLNGGVLLVGLGIALFKGWKVNWLTSLQILLVMLALTAVFDSVIIGLGIVDYNPYRILHVRVGLAPLEDFAYAILAAILGPVLWKAGDKT